METSHLIDILISIVVGGIGWYLTNQAKEIKRLEILLNKTREETPKEYATKDELRNGITCVMEALHRVEDKLDRALTEK